MLAASFANVVTAEDMAASVASYGAPASEASMNHNMNAGNKGKDCFTGFSFGLEAAYSHINQKLKPGYIGGTNQVFVDESKVSPNMTAIPGFGIGVVGNVWTHLTSCVLAGVSVHLTAFTQKRAINTVAGYMDEDASTEPVTEFINMADISTRIKSPLSFNVNFKLGYLVAPSALLFGLVGYAYRTMRATVKISRNDDRAEMLDDKVKPDSVYMYKASDRLHGLNLGMGTELALNKRAILALMFVRTFYSRPKMDLKQKSVTPADYAGTSPKDDIGNFSIRGKTSETRFTVGIAYKI
jgi:opacity protein-like surface antigen